MNKIVSLLWIAFLLANNLYAQTEYGMRVGVSYSTMTGEDVELFNVIDDSGTEVNTQGKIGYNVGVYLRMPLSKNLFFRPELAVASRGIANQEAIFRGYDAKFYKYNFTYVDLPLLLQVGNAQGGFYLFVGPQFSYLLNAQRKLENERINIEDIIGEKPANFAVFGVLGGAYEFGSGLNIALRAEYGATKIAKDTKANIITIQASLGFHISNAQRFGHKSLRRF